MSLAVWIFSLLVTLAGYFCQRYPKILLSTYMKQESIKSPIAYVNFTSQSLWITAAFILINYYMCLLYKAVMIADIAVPLTLIWGVVGISFASQNIGKKGAEYYKKSLAAILIAFIFLSVLMFLMVQQ